MKILVVESNRNLLSSFERYFKVKNFTIKTAFDGVIAINEFEDDIDILLIDSATPRISPFELISTLKKKKDSLKVILIIDDFLISTKTLDDNQLINEFITKPFIEKELDWIVSQIKLKDDKQEPFMTYKEKYLLNLMSSGKIDYKNIDYDIIKKEEVNEYLKAIEAKIERKDNNV